MSGYFDNLIARAQATPPAIQPRVAARFEQPLSGTAPDLDLWSGETEAAAREPVVARPSSIDRNIASPERRHTRQPGVELPTKQVAAHPPAPVAPPWAQPAPPHAAPPNSRTTDRIPPTVPAVPAQPITPRLPATPKSVVVQSVTSHQSPGAGQGSGDKGQGSADIHNTQPVIRNPSKAERGAQNAELVAEGSGVRGQGSDDIRNTQYAIHDPSNAELSTQQAELASTAPVIRVTIGRIEVRAAAPPAPAPRPAAPPSGPRLSLDAYLERRGGGGR